MIPRLPFFALSISFLCVLSADARTGPFILGADISWVDQREASGQKYADNGSVKDIFQILKDHRFNCIRLRLFVDPTAKVPGSSESPYSTQGFCGLSHTLTMAKRIKNAGMKFLLDFHYSDVWADPGKQFKPVSWDGLSFEQLTAKVRSYTKETLEACRTNGTLPDMVQVGNEIVGGMIWPDGKSGNMTKFATLVNAGIDGVMDVDTTITIVIHSISENSPSNWLKSLIDAGVKRIDVFGLSYYSKWHGTPDDLQKRLNDAVKNHTVKIAVAEYADNHRKVNDIIYNLPGEQGLGTFVWEPTEWMDALFDNQGGKRVTNSRIDLYPQMSKDYGNDDVSVIAGHVAEEGAPSRYAAGKSPAAPRLWFDRDGTAHYRGVDFVNAEYSLFTVQGTIAARGRLSAAGEGSIVIRRGDSRPLAPGMYLMTLSGAGYRAMTSLVHICR